MPNEEAELIFKELTTDNELFIQFDEKNGVLLLDVKYSFDEVDFLEISQIVDPYYNKHGELAGIIINSKKFPYWENAKIRGQYLNFVRNNHYKFKKAALAMEGFFVKIIAKIAQGRIHPKVKMFKYKQIPKAQSWILFG